MARQIWARRCASRAKNCFANAIAVEEALGNAAASAVGLSSCSIASSSSRSSAGDRPPACLRCVCRRKAWKRAPRRPAAARTSPMIRAPLAARRPLQGVERRIGILRRYHREKLPLVGDVQRIQPQQLACAADCVAHRNAVFEQKHRRARNRARIRSSAVATPPRVGSRIHRTAGRRRRGHGLDHLEHRARIGAQIGFQVELAARQQDGDSVVADGPRKQDRRRRAARNAPRTGLREWGGRRPRW